MIPARTQITPVCPTISPCGQGQGKHTGQPFCEKDGEGPGKGVDEVGSIIGRMKLPLMSPGYLGRPDGGSGPRHAVPGR